MFGIDDAALIGAGASIIGTGIGAASQGSMNKKTREFNREEAEKQRQWNENMADKQNAWNYEMWMKEQEYNNPVNQMQRLRDAGLNPLFYGLDGNSVGSAQAAAQPLGYDRASMDNMPNPFEGFSDLALRIAQVANIQADTAKKGEETLTEVQRREKFVVDIANAKQEFNNMLADEKLTDTKRREIEKALEWTDRMNEAALAETESRTKLSDSQRNRIDKLLEGELNIQIKTIEDFDKQWKKISAECAKIAAETGLAQKDIENYALNHASNGFMGTGLSLQNLRRLAKESGSKNDTAYGNLDVNELIQAGQ